MANNKIEYEIKIIGDAVERLKKLTSETENLGNAASTARNKLAGIGKAIVVFNQAAELIGKCTAKFREFTDANRIQAEAEAKLGQVMRNTMGATDAQVQSIKELASAQQRLGVIGDEVQLGGAQELSTYLSKADSLKKLMPVMNDMLAQQYGLNATQEQAVQIGSMMGKVMDGQVGALSRYGYKFDEAQEKLLKYGTEEQRVATLAEVIEQSVGGMNEALAATPEGRLQQVANDFGDVKERLGDIIVKLETKLVPIMDGLIGLANGLIDVVQMGWPLWVGAAVATLVAVTKVHHKLQQTSLAALLTGGSFTTMKALAQVACRGISTAIMSIPIVGWIAGIITLLIGAFTTLWNKCEAFRGALTGAWEVVKNTVGNLWEMVQPHIEKLRERIRSLWDNTVGRVQQFIAWMKGIFSKVGAWFNKVMAPVKNWFSGLWDTVKGILDKIVSWMGKVFNPIIELWNKLTNGNVQKFKAGYESGAKKVREGKQKKDALAPGLPDPAVGDTTGGAAAGSKAVKESVTGGTRNTTVNISLGSMVENIVFNGSFEENSQQLETRIREVLTRTLLMAAAV